MPKQLLFIEIAPGQRGEQIVNPAVGEQVTIGRSTQCNVVRRFVNGAVSRIHATVTWDGEKWLVIDGTPTDPSTQGIYDKFRAKISTTDANGKITPFVLRDPGDLLYIVLANQRGEEAYLKVDDGLGVKSSEPPTLRLGEQIEEARLQAEKNGEELQIIKAQNLKQEEKLDTISKALDSAKQVAEFAVWLSARSKQLYVAMLILLPGGLLILLFKYLGFDGGMANLFDYFLTQPAAEQGDKLKEKEK